MKKMVSTGVPLTPAKETQALKRLGDLQQKIYNAIEARDSYMKVLVENHDISLRKVAKAIGSTSPQMVKNVIEGQVGQLGNQSIGAFRKHGRR